MEILVGVGSGALAVLAMALVIYGVAHPLLNHGRAGLALLVFLFPILAPVYALLHRCRPRASSA